MKRLFSWEMGTVIPAILLLALFAEVSSRFIPASRLAFRSWEAVANQDSTKSSAVFRPNTVKVSRKSYGDLAVMGNLRDLREYRREVFTTDELGYRNPSNYCLSGPPDAMLLGTSFSVGSGVADDQTLSARLQSRTGMRIYNAAGFNMDVARCRALARQLGMNGGVVIYEYLERYDVPQLVEYPTEPNQPGISRDSSGGIVTPPGKQTLWDWCSNNIKKWKQFSTMQIVLRRACQRLQNDQLLPNQFAAKVCMWTLRDGSRHLFLPLDVSTCKRVRPVQHVTAYFSWVGRELRKENLELLVVLTPDKYSVYQPLITDERVASEAPCSYLDSVETQVRNAGVPVVNLTRTFRKEAEAGLARGQYLYWRDDTHWNPFGIDVAAREVQGALLSLTRSEAH